MKVALIGDSLTDGRPGVSFSNFLKEKYPNITFVNLGKSGETVKSLHTHLTKTQLDTDYDLAFLWIGVNDVYSKLLKVQAQPIAKDHEEFRAYFTQVFEIILHSAKHVVAVTPAVVGETTTNEANNELRDLSAIIQTIAHKHPNSSFLNLQSVFEKHLSKVNSSEYIGTSVMSVMKAVFFYKNPTKIDQLSQKRGLHLTLDGIHLNSSGARIVADEYASFIESLFYNEAL